MKNGQPWAVRNILAGLGLAALLAVTLAGLVSAQTVAVTDDPGLGQILTDPDGRTLYIFDADQPGVSNCDDPCAEFWPPYVITGEPVAAAGVGGELALISRPDGAMQLTYNGMPLYYFFGDTQPGQTNGQGRQAFGGGWFVVNPSAGEAAATVTVRSGTALGDILTTPDGWTLYRFTRDQPGVSVRDEAGARSWPPLVVEAEPVAPVGLAGTLALGVRPEGGTQVTYNGMPLYRYSGDTQPGDTNGEGQGGVWFVVNP